MNTSPANPEASNSLPFKSYPAIPYGEISRAPVCRGDELIAHAFGDSHIEAENRAEIFASALQSLAPANPSPAMVAAHSALPWYFNGTCIYAAEGTSPIIQTTEANAALIVRAVNSRDALVAALGKAQDMIERLRGVCYHLGGVKDHEILIESAALSDICVSALARAKEVQP
jgi:hypothetical protein